MLSFKVELAIYNLAKKARNKDELEKLSLYSTLCFPAHENIIRVHEIIDIGAEEKGWNVTGSFVYDGQELNLGVINTEYV